ncbi:hypothetical protein H4696_000318 [Amycolatopsis lexingtonensis]|uniref:GntR family transcriptional regulator n=1 Tax=Amycolatopsis lexingtonensis TaxID=218822 RepID=A0ABR9HQK0_9PSEU|nr:hypothetical protein [Amycolatopsis lexingtonensis]MBE1493218.1 hypothetical protein [Amycolatopsis lexingtonensis]
MSYEHLAAIRLVRHELEQAHQDGRRRPTQRALAHTTGLTQYAVKGALNALKLGWGEASLHSPPTDAITSLLTAPAARRR